MKKADAEDAPAMKSMKSMKAQQRARPYSAEGLDMELASRRADRQYLPLQISIVLSDNPLSCCFSAECWRQ